MPLRTFIRDGKVEIKQRTTSPAGHWSPERNRSRQKRFRAAVLARDDYTCQRCGRRDPTGTTLEAHHLRDGYDVADGITVCGRSAPTNCHRAIDQHAR